MLHALPVFSNIGEINQILPLAKRDRLVLVFGSPGNRLRVYQESWAELELTCQQLKISEIWDIGPSTGLKLSTINKIPIVEFGERSAAEISSFLSNALVGFFDYPPDYRDKSTCLTKSTIFAAYCAHGLLPVSSRYNLPVDGIEAGKHYWFPEIHTGLKERMELQTIADNAYAWYQTHSLSIQAKTFAALCTDTRQ
jgi:hypothetical protein